MIASVIRNSLSEVGTLPTIARMASANAMSVAVGMAQPFRASGSSLFSRKKITAGTRMPPMPAMPGNITCRISASSPTISSRLTSMPIIKKKTAISPSFTQRKNGLLMSSAPTRIWIGTFSNAP